MIDDTLADDIVRSFEHEPERWKKAVERDGSPYISWSVRDDGLRVGVGFVTSKRVAVQRGDYQASLTHRRSIERVWKAYHVWLEWLRVTTLKTIAEGP